MHDRKEPAFGNEFRKPVWYDDESDDELFDNNKIFGVQIFTNPLEMQKYYEAQMKEMMKNFENFDGTHDSVRPNLFSLKLIFRIFTEHKSLFDENIREEYMKPGFEDIVGKEFRKKTVDTDLDGEIYADQLHSLLQRVTPELNNMIAIDALDKSRKAAHEKSQAVSIAEANKKLSDEEKVLSKIHGTFGQAETSTKKTFQRNQIARQIPHNGGAFEGVIGGPKTFRQGFTFQMIRRPDGSSESRRTVIDNDGNAKTIVKRTVDGKTETFTTLNGADGDGGQIERKMPTENAGSIALDCGRNLFVSKDGYVLPKNLWWLEIVSSVSIDSIVFFYVVVVFITSVCLPNIYVKTNESNKRLTHKIVIATFSWKQNYFEFFRKFDVGYDFR